MERYTFNEELFKKFHVCLEMPTQDFLRGTGIPNTTWRNWRRTKDIPLNALMKVCNALRMPIGHFIRTNEDDGVMIGMKHYIKEEGNFKEAVFLNSEFGFEVTTLQERSVTDFCEFVGISTFYFYRNLRHQDRVGDGFGIRQFLHICNKTKTYPMDFLISSGVTVPVLPGYTRKHEANVQMMTSKNRGTMSQYASMKKSLQAEREKVKALEKEVERLKSALLEKRQEIVVLQGELDDKRMMAAEEGEG